MDARLVLMIDDEKKVVEKERENLSRIRQGICEGWKAASPTSATLPR